MGATDKILDKFTKDLKKNASGTDASKWKKNAPPDAGQMDAALRQAAEFLALAPQVDTLLQDNEKEWRDDIARAREARDLLTERIAAADALLEQLRGTRETVKACNDQWLGLADKIIPMQARPDPKKEKLIEKLHGQAETIRERGRKAMEKNEDLFDKSKGGIGKVKAL
ncbi:MAG: hypothetical protein KDK24_04840 [Pseudooceanicola sp.]|nr:hypothetical protein [Pseudooceanicola sp.]